MHNILLICLSFQKGKAINLWWKIIAKRDIGFVDRNIDFY